MTGSNSGFGESGKIQEGDVIRFGSLEKPGTYFGDAVVVSIANTSQLTIASTAGLSGAAIAATSYLPLNFLSLLLTDTTVRETLHIPPSTMELLQQVLQMQQEPFMKLV